MTNEPQLNLCPEERLSQLVASMQSGEGQYEYTLSGLLDSFPDDPRLHFLNGSILASQQEYHGARYALRRALDLAPDFAIARFQLGLLHLTSGEVIPSQEVWGPLYALEEDHYLRVFVEGLNQMARDEFSRSIGTLQRGISINQENVPLNENIQMVIEEMRQSGMGNSSSAASSAQLLLQQALIRSTKH